MAPDRPQLLRPLSPYFEGPCRAWAIEALRVYCNPTPDGHWWYTGAWYDRYADRQHPDEFTANDLVAVKMLAVEVPPRAAIWILEDGNERLSNELVQVGPDRPITEAAESDLADGADAATLWHTLR